MEAIRASQIKEADDARAKALEEKRRIAEYWKSFSAESRKNDAEQDRQLNRVLTAYKEIAKKRTEVATYEMQIQEQIKKIEEVKAWIETMLKK